MKAAPIKTYLEPALRREIARLARAQGRSESAVIAEAVRARFSARLAAEPNPEGARGEPNLARLFNRLDRRLDKTIRDQALVKEAVLLFVRVWLEYNPPLDARLADSAAASAEARFEHFLDLLMQGLAPKRSVAAHLFEEMEQEAAAMAQAPAAPSSAQATGPGR